MADRLNDRKQYVSPEVRCLLLTALSTILSTSNEGGEEGDEHDW